MGPNTGSKKKKKKKPKVTYLTGTVVHKNPFAVSYSISSGGGLSAIHTKDPSTLPAPGTKVKVPIRKLANGTYAEDGKREVQGLATFAKFQGVVTDSRDGTNPGDPDVYTVSGRGASVMVYTPDSTGTTPPVPVGSLVTPTVEIRTRSGAPLPPASALGTCGAPVTPFPTSWINPEQQLWQTGISVVSTAPIAATEIETLVQKSCTSPAPGSVVVSSDDVREGLSDVELIASGVDPGTLVQGQVVIASVKVSAGVLTEITGTVSDQGINGAGSRASAQGKFYRTTRASDRHVERVFARASKRAARR